MLFNYAFYLLGAIKLITDPKDNNKIPFAIIKE